MPGLQILQQSRSSWIRQKVAAIRDRMRDGLTLVRRVVFASACTKNFCWEAIAGPGLRDSRIAGRRAVTRRNPASRVSPLRWKKSYGRES